MSAAYERLPERDAAFLLFETPDTHMHLGGVAVFDAGPLAAPGGGVDAGRIRDQIAARLHQIPHYRQRLAWIPVLNHPVWIDDDHFNLAYHVRHTSLPRPGREEQLKLLAARVISQPLDRDRPLWEAWIVEGLEGGRFALVVKTHHCMADGLSAVDLFTVLLNPEPEEAIDPPPAWTPRPAPSGATLLRDELARRAATPWWLARGLGGLVREPARVRTELPERLGAIWQLVSAGLPLPAATPLNRPIGPHRRFDWLGLSLADVKQVRDRLGGTVNDVVLTAVTGGVGRFLARRGSPVADLEYRVVVPVSVRRPGATSSNQASGWLLTVPIGEGDPRRRHEVVKATTAHLKASKQALGPESLLSVIELAGPLVFTLGVRLTSRLAPYNLIVTNVPGPPVPLFLLGAPMVAGYPLAPLFENQGLAIAVFSYRERLFLGFNADFDLVPDLADLVRDVETAFDELCAAGEPQRASRRAAP